MKKQIFEDLKVAMKNKDVLAKGVLQLLKAKFDITEKEKGSELTQSEAIAVVQSEIKQTKQALDGAVKAQREDLIVKENLKIKILGKYLPRQLSEQEVKLELQAIGVNSTMNMGQAMKLAKSHLDGHADNSMISKVVKELIQSKS